jgi:hypothetical protein
MKRGDPRFFNWNLSLRSNGKWKIENGKLMGLRPAS